jgi:hypothetical protein
MSKRASPRPDELIEVLDYATGGGWLDAVSNLIRWLRVAGCYEYVHCLDREVQSLSLSPRPEDEAAALVAICGSLARLHNEPPRHLTQDQLRDLAGLRRRATRFVRHRQRDLATSSEGYKRAVAGLAARLDALPAEALSGRLELDPQTPAEDKSHTNGPEGGRWLWWKNVRHDVPQGTVYRLLDYMWGRDSAGYEDLIDNEVFESAVQPQTVRSNANKVNNALPSGIPWRLSADSVGRQLTKVSSAQSRSGNSSRIPK